MLVGRWWVVRNDGRRAGRKVQQDPKPQQQIGLPKTAAADWIAHLERGATTTIMALQKWGGRGSDDVGAAVLREE